MNYRTSNKPFVIIQKLKLWMLLVYIYIYIYLVVISQIEGKRREALNELKKAAKKDWYKILELSKNATKKEIKEAYHKMAKKWHPDKHHEADGDTVLIIAYIYIIRWKLKSELRISMKHMIFSRMRIIAEIMIEKMNLMKNSSKIISNIILLTAEAQTTMKLSLIGQIIL